MKPGRHSREPSDVHTYAHRDRHVANRSYRFARNEYMAAESSNPAWVFRIGRAHLERLARPDTMGRALCYALAALAAAIVIIAAVLPYTLLIRVGKHYLANMAVRAPKTLVSVEHPRLKTGDIILFVAAVQSMSNSVTQTVYTHAAVVLRDGDDVWLSETQGGSPLMPNLIADPTGRQDIWMAAGAVINPFLVRVKHYAGGVFLMRLSRPLEPEREEELLAAADAASRAAWPYPTLAEMALEVTVKRRYRARHCFAHVAHLLAAAGLSPKKDAGTLQVCREICELPGRQLAGGHTYEPPVQLLYDIGLAQSSSASRSAQLLHGGGLTQSPSATESAQLSHDQDLAQSSSTTESSTASRLAPAVTTS